MRSRRASSSRRSLLLAAALACRALHGCANTEPSDDLWQLEEPQRPIAASVDVRGWDRDAGPPPPRDATAARLRPLGIGLSARRGTLYWAEHEADRIRGVRLDGTSLGDVVVGVDGPISVAVDDSAGKVYWTTDSSYPRRIERADFDGRERETLLEGRAVNRPRAIAVDPVAGLLFWSEAVSGRLRRLSLDGGEVTDILTSGYGERDRNDSAELKVLGLSVTSDPSSLYWTDLARDSIARAAHDGSALETILSSRASVDHPAGIAVDAAAGLLYWVDVAGAAIWRARLDGGEPTRIVGRDGGLVEPWGLVLDARHGLLYWTDASLDRIGRCRLDGTHVASLDLRAAGAGAGETWRTVGLPGEGRDCVADAARARRIVLLEAEKLVAACLREIDTRVAVRREPAEVESAATPCIAQLARLDLDRPESILADFGRIAPACTEAEAIDVLHGWRREVSRTTAQRFVRAARWLSDVRPFVAARAPRHRAAASALRVLDELVELLGPERSRRAPTPGYVASGQTTSYRAHRAGDAAWVGVPDDGFVRAGPPLRYRDNGDGTILDLSTGLVWEKKCSGCGGLHDRRTAYAWNDEGAGDSVHEWLQRINREGGDGFAGRSDWRLPNVAELQSLIDYERFNPAVGDAFNRPACGAGCSDVTDHACSCVDNGEYWSSTTMADAPGDALVVGFNLGLVGDLGKGERIPARAVRGGPD